jgi:hypothetical protein
LPNTIDTSDPLFDPHRIPRHVEVHDDVAELKVQTFATRVSGNQDPNIARERLLSARPCFKVHAAVQRDNREPTAFQKLRKHRLCRHELGENQCLQFGIVFLLLNLVD